MGKDPDVTAQKREKKKRILPSQAHGVSTDPKAILRLSPLNMEAIKLEDKALRDSGKPPRVGVGRSIDTSPNTHGKWHAVSTDESLWLFGIHSPSAVGIRIHFTDFFLPAGVVAGFVRSGNLDSIRFTFFQWCLSSKEQLF